jgi:uncharacterized membrane protein YfcA
MPVWIQDLIGHDLIAHFVSVAVSSAGLLAIATVLIAGFLRGFVGFGSSLIIVMVLSVVVGPPAAVGVAGLSGIAPVAQLLPNAIRYSERSFVVPFGLFTFLAAPIGTWMLVAADPNFMKIVISLFVLVMVVMLYRDWRPRHARKPGFLMLAGAVSGLIQGGSGVGGPPAVAIALSRDGTAQTQRANVIGATTALTLCGLPPLWYNGVFTWQVIVLSLVSVPFYMFGTWLGARAFGQHGSRYFRNAALLSLAVVGVLTLGLAAYEYRG